METNFMKSDLINSQQIAGQLKSVPTPAYIVDKRLLKKNLEVLNFVQQETGAKILLALKGFSMYSLFPLIGKYLSGITASSLFEAKLGYEEMAKEVHIYAPAYQEQEFDEIMTYCDHIVFNSKNQYHKFKDRVKENHNKNIECGLRVNPEYSEIKTAIYNPCYQYSRLGEKLANLEKDDLIGLSGIHFHTMCEQNSDTLERTIKVFEEKFGKFLTHMKWINFGGGHHITRADYDIQKLIDIINYIKNKYHVDIYLEPGEAIPLNTGFLVASVLDIIENDMKIAILDTSAACHMPDVIEMPYRPKIIGAKEKGENKYTYRLGGMTCLAGDIIGDYSFAEPLKIGDKLIFCDMGHYTMVKNNMFNGVNLPLIATLDESGIKIIREFNYCDYKNRLS